MKLWITLLFLLLATSTQAADYYVAKTGSGSTCSLASPCLTIATGLSKLAGGDNLYIRTGTYNESLRLASIPSGSAGSPTTIQSYQNELVTLTGSDPYPLWFGADGSNHSYITVKGSRVKGSTLTFDGQNVRAVASLASGGSSGGTLISNITLDGIELQNASVCESVLYAGPTSGGQNILDGQNSVVRNSFIHDNGLNPDTCAPPHNGHFFHGIYITGSNMTFSHNEIYNISGLGIQNYGDYTPSNNTFSYNYIHNTGRYTGVNGSATALLLYSGGNHKAFGNLIINNQQGIVTNTSNNTIVNNTVYGTGVNQACSGTGGDYCIAAISIFGGSGNVIRNNIIYNNNDNTVDSSGCSGCTVSDNVFSNPNFVNPSGGDFHLQASSTAAIDHGANLGGTYSPDYAGVARPTIGPWEVGAYEFGGTTPPPTCPSVPNALVASYGFEGNGNDSSGVNTATLGSGWSYTTGKYGQGVISTGVSAITVADANALDVCGGFTYEAWVSIPNTSGDYALINKNPDSSSFLFASVNGYCGSGMPIGGYETTIACYGTPLSTGVFQHLAVTYDSSLASANVKLYLNGTPVSTADGSTLINPTTGTLQFCGSSFGELCPSGTIIDEVRIYNYARSGAQIITDRDTAVIAPALTPPTLKLSGIMKFGASAVALKLNQQ